MKNLSIKTVRSAKISGATANTSDTISTICDMGTANAATAIVNLEYTTNPIVELKFWTSSVAGDMVATPIVETTTISAVAITSDADGIAAVDSSNVAITDLAVASNGITALAADGVYAIELPNIKRYLCAQWTSTGTGSTVGISFLGKDLVGSSTAKAAY